MRLGVVCFVTILVLIIVTSILFGVVWVALDPHEITQQAKEYYFTRWSSSIMVCCVVGAVVGAKIHNKIS